MVAEQRCSAASLVDALVTPIMEEIVKAVKGCSYRSGFLRGSVTRIADVHVSQIVEQVTEVPKTSNCDRTFAVHSGTES